MARGRSRPAALRFRPLHAAIAAGADDPVPRGSVVMAEANGGMFERDRSALLVIDVQQSFIDKLPYDVRGPLVQRIAWLMRVARLLEIPIVATAEDVDRSGPLVPELASELPPGSTIHNKMIF